MAADTFANEVRVLMREHAGGNKRIGVDKIMVHGLRALEAQGFEVMEGEEVTEKSRSVKGPDEILAMRCANHACETAVADGGFRPRNVPLATPPKTIFGPSCTPKTSNAAANGLKRACCPRARAPTRGFRNAAPASRRTTKSSPLIPI